LTNELRVLFSISVRDKKKKKRKKKKKKKKGKSSLERTVIDEKKIKYFTRTSQKNNKTSDQKSNLK